MRTPRAAFFSGEGRLLLVLFWGWIASERAKPVLLNLETGQPVPTKPSGR